MGELVGSGDGQRCARCGGSGVRQFDSDGWEACDCLLRPAAPAAGADPAADGAKIRDEMTREIAAWMAAPHEPEQWQIDNADDLAANLLTGPLAALVAQRDQAQGALARVEALATTWEQRTRSYAAADDRDKVTELRQRATALRRALDDEAAS